MLAGRDAERAAIAALLDAARTGTGGALVVRGVPGSGKSTLLTDTVGSASGMTVLRTQGVESESPLAFAALQRLLWPLRSRLRALPAPQRTALRSALGEAEGDGDRFLAFLGTLSLLADAAEDAPVLAVVDDAHWLDDASAAALLFVARRLQAERLALLFAARDGGEGRFISEDLPALTLGGISGGAADALLGGHTGDDVDPAVRDRLVAGTAGNALALVELAGVLSGDQLAGRAPLPAQLPLTGGVERAFLDRYRRLSDAAQRFVLVASADDTSRLTVVREAAERLGVAEDALDEVERAGLLRVEGNVLSLHHPLVRSAVYRAAPSAQRRATHRALADVLDTDADRRAWHRAAAADRPDDTVVAALDAVAERAAGRGGHEAAAAAWARAAELTSGEARGRRLYLAASSVWLGAHPSRATALAAAAAVDVTDPRTRAQLLALQGHIESHTRSLDDGYDLILRAAEVAAGVDEGMAHSLAMIAAALSAFGAHSPRRVDPAALVPAPAENAPIAVRTAFALLHGYVAVARRDWAAAAASFRYAFALADDEPLHDQHVLQPNLGLAAMLIDDDERGLRLHAQHLSATRRAGALSWVEHALTRGVHAQIATGAWAQAVAAASEALPLAASTGRAGLTALPTAQLALLAALRGDDAADGHLTEVAALRQAHRIGGTDGLVLDLTHWAAGLRAAKRPATALHHFEQLSVPALRRMAALDLLETAIRSGRDDVARAWLGEVQQFAEATGIASAIAVAEHGRALLADSADAAEEHFRRALAAHADSARRPDHARTELAFGAHLRRARRRVDAREHLRAALALFEDLGAAPWAERAAQELRASGETARRRDVSTATRLTAQERQVAALVRQGLSNRDAAAQLFVSPRTIDFHLRNVFGKLGVTSRAELTALQLDV